MSVKGGALYNKFKQGKSLTRGQAILAQCYICNGENEGGVDCQGGNSCPLYQYFPFRGKKDRKRGTFRGSGDTVEA